LLPEIVEQEHQEVQLQQDVEEDPEEVVFEDDEAEEPPQLYDGVLLEVDADRDIVIPPVVEAALAPDAVE
jgi:BarA-like signal transduction histidine kinase